MARVGHIEFRPLAELAGALLPAGWAARAAAATALRAE
jgi:hypothetical protein